MQNSADGIHRSDRAVDCDVDENTTPVRLRVVAHRWLVTCGLIGTSAVGNVWHDEYLRGFLLGFVNGNRWFLTSGSEVSYIGYWMSLYANLTRRDDAAWVSSERIGLQTGNSIANSGGRMGRQDSTNNERYNENVLQERQQTAPLLVKKTENVLQERQQSAPVLVKNRVPMTTRRQLSVVAAT